MKKFLHKFVQDTHFTPPPFIIRKLTEYFHEPISIEWQKTGEFFEAIFYKDQREYIALLDEKGSLIEYRMFLPDNFLPLQIKHLLNKKGEIMNSVLLNRGNTIAYEVILRDSKLDRFLLNINETGDILNEEKL